ncbi:nitrogen regulation protein NR(I) [Parapusillimonas granuli]|uniref:DNA-binding transcriptional regulator NtrC n=1 Tax=Parapusillimonas granuli TaxID=380911 RepID=A0A853G9S3_9BURK|nr:nitrogen regulation protein NR(I) [Parapusillimonas granuli]MBB5214247.1 two-component system nitrogen regulation response regulator GlnG [Parapusillimonas granuli]NYT51351.1 nitrogen regulation protein NR(I) [Parapusillimonas granuli]
MKAVWIVDDDQSIRWVLEKALARASMPVRSFASAAEALDALQDGAPAVLVTDVRMPGQDGLALLQRIKREHPGLPVIVMTAFSDLNSTVEAFQKGAFDYLPKPFDVNVALSLIRRAAQTAEPDDAAVPDTGGGAAAAGRIMMQSLAPAMQEVFRAIGRLASSAATVLITGESGTGKELIARALHEHSNRAGGPFVALNAAAIPKDLLEAELFGHERGAFTGATQQRRGRFEEAGGGTLFLDEIGDMPFELQTRLLRVLAEGSFYRVGGSQAIRADVRIVAATHQPLEQRVAEGRFREDLFHRLNVIRLRLPPLRERKEDIPALVRLFLQHSAADMGVPVRRLTPEALRALSAFDYPGNIRQLENFCQWLTVMSSGQVIEPKDLPPEILAWQERGAAPTGSAAAQDGGALAPDAPAAEPPSPEWLEPLAREVGRRLARNEPAVMATLARDFERVLLETALDYSRGRRMEAAQRLGIGRNTLTRKCAELGISD